MINIFLLLILFTIQDCQLFVNHIAFADTCYKVAGLRDKSEKPGETLCNGFVPDLQRIARLQLIVAKKMIVPKLIFKRKV